MNRAELKAAAKAQIKGNIGTLFLCYVIVFLITIAVGFIPKVGSAVTVIITPPFTVGLTLIYLGLIKGKKAELGTLFEGFTYIGKAVFLMAIVGIFTFLWSLLLIIPGIIKTLSYSMAYYVLAEHPEMSAREALNESKAMMDGHKWELFVLELSFLPWILLTGITFGIAAVYVVPYQSSTIANFYQKIKRQPQEVVYGDMI